MLKKKSLKTIFIITGAIILIAGFFIAHSVSAPAAERKSGKKAEKQDRRNIVQPAKPESAPSITRTEKKLKGKIIEIGQAPEGDTEKGKKGYDPGVRLKLKLSDERTVNVDLGPKSYVSRVSPNLSVGEEVTVIGFTVRLGEIFNLSAKEMRRRSGETPQFRGDDGRPLWRR